MKRALPLQVYVFVGLGLLAFSFSPILVRLASDAPGLAIAVWRTLWAAVIIGPVAVYRARGEWRLFRSRDMLLVGMAGVFLALHFILWIESLYYTSVASASVLVTTSPLFLAIFGYLLLGERLTLRTIGAILLAMGGSVVLNWGDLQRAAFPEAWKGNLLALMAAVLFTFYILIGRVIRQRVGWLAYVAPLYTVVALTCLVIAWLWETPLTGYPPAFYLICLLLALGPQIVGHGSFNYAVRYVSPALLGLLSLSEPVLASLLAWILFGEQPPLLSVVGMVIILLAIALAMLPERERA